MKNTSHNKLRALALAAALLVALAGCGTTGDGGNRSAAGNALIEAGEAAKAAEAQSAAAAEGVPDFSFTTYTGETHSLADFLDKPLLLNFSGTWCGPCQQEFPELEALHTTYAGQYNLLVVCVGDSDEAVDSFFSQNGYTFPVVNDVDGAIAALFGAGAFVPQSFIIDTGGVVVSTIDGGSTLDIMLEELEKAG